MPESLEYDGSTWTLIEIVDGVGLYICQDRPGELLTAEEDGEE